ncbi:unnamed protein product [Nyctereutes procyonoides]|uniref:(raccoon dog) hypothetical protein n=1 Tax=Nyctereutes procyonoides TaxID=34880 RepID=A0A811XYV8_NYCPR|nr:unnamed protein product [Nyctereutes procyonoides]
MTRLLLLTLGIMKTVSPLLGRNPLCSNSQSPSPLSPWHPPTYLMPL